MQRSRTGIREGDTRTVRVLCEGKRQQDRYRHQQGCDEGASAERWQGTAQPLPSIVGGKDEGDRITGQEIHREQADLVATQHDEGGEHSGERPVRDT